MRYQEHSLVPVLSLKQLSLSPTVTLVIARIIIPVGHIAQRYGATARSPEVPVPQLVSTGNSRDSGRVRQALAVLFLHPKSISFTGRDSKPSRLVDYSTESEL